MNPTAEIIHGDCLNVIPQLGRRFACVCTDPPYSSGATHKAQMSRGNEKYYSGEAGRKSVPIAFDRMGQRAFLSWMREWLSFSREVCDEGAYGFVFCDWRQLPLVSDAFQMAGWDWRGLVVWDKGRGARLVDTQYFRHQSEFVVWGTNGAITHECRRDDYDGVWRGNKPRFENTGHPMAKPIDLLKHLISAALPGDVLDPFCGSGMTLLAARELGRNSVGIELSDHYVEVARLNVNPTPEQLAQKGELAI